MLLLFAIRLVNGFFIALDRVLLKDMVLQILFIFSLIFTLTATCNVFAY